MDDKNKFIPTTSMNIVRTGIAFMLAMKQEYGIEKGLEIWDALRITLGDDVSGDILFGQLADIKSGRIMLQNCGPQKIRVIKVIRQYTHLGLKLALELVNYPRIHDKAIEIPTENSNFSEINNFVRDLRIAGALIDY